MLLNCEHRTSEQSIVDPETYLLFFIDLICFGRSKDVIHAVGPSDEITPPCVGLVGMDISVFSHLNLKELNIYFVKIRGASLLWLQNKRKVKGYGMIVVKTTYLPV